MKTITPILVLLMSTALLALPVTVQAKVEKLVAPTVNITTPAGNKASVSSATLALSGKSSNSGSLVVTGVLFSVNGSAWKPATTVNQWSTWTATVKLPAGTNAIMVEALNNGGLSDTDSVSVQYAVLERLTVKVSPANAGTIVPDDACALLNIGQNYKVTAKAEHGFAFSNWVGGTGSVLGYLTNTAALRFAMQSNLTLEANFLDVGRPTVAIVNPPMHEKVYVANFTIAGVAADNVAVRSVYYSVNDSGWALADNVSGNWSHWTAALTLTAGKNIISAYAVDTSGNVSRTNRVHLHYAAGTGSGTGSPTNNLAGLEAITSSGATICFGTNTLSQFSTDANGITGVGNYTYTQTTPTSGVLSVTFVAPPAAVSGSYSNLTLTFVDAADAMFTNPDGSTGTLQLQPVAPPAPVASLAGQTVYLVQDQGVGSEDSFGAGTVTAADLSANSTSPASYTYAVYGAAGLITISATNGTTYIVTAAAAADQGSFYEEDDNAAAAMMSTHTGLFGLASQNSGGNAPASLTGITAEIYNLGDASALSLGNGSFSQFDVSDPNNFSVNNGIGAYAYSQPDANNGLLDLTYTAPAAAIGGSSANILFVTPDFGIFTNSTGNSGNGPARLTAEYGFTGGSDGANPYGNLVLSGNTLYGTTIEGGANGSGVVFAVNTDGTGFRTLYSFTGGNDGANPGAGLVVSGHTLYGTATGGGADGVGTVFAVNTDGTGFTTLYSFTGFGDGSFPYASLVLSGNTLYGTTYGGGANSLGTIFAVNTDGSGFNTVYSFTGGNDGSNPFASLALSGNTLYGTALHGGANGEGTVFAVNTDGSGFTTLYGFTGATDGSGLVAGMVLSGNTLYGMTQTGGANGAGVVFAVNTDGAGFNTLYSFTGGPDGGSPSGGLTLSDGILYGATQVGGANGNGTVFSINTDGSGFSVLHSLTGGNDGVFPLANLVVSGSMIYGTASQGGVSGETLTATSQSQIGNVSSLTFASGAFNYTAPDSSTGDGTYTYTVAGPGGAQVLLNFTDGDYAGSTGSVQLNFTVPDAGWYFTTNPDGSFDWGSFTLAP
jgi:uncharacterized repeat protein (TIGR03803 family)